MDLITINITLVAIDHKPNTIWNENIFSNISGTLVSIVKIKKNKSSMVLNSKYLSRIKMENTHNNDNKKESNSIATLIWLERNLIFFTIKELWHQNGHI